MNELEIREEAAVKLAGKGFFGHKGRKGKRGGSLPRSGGVASLDTTQGGSQDDAGVMTRLSLQPDEKVNTKVGTTNGVMEPEGGGSKRSVTIHAGDIESNKKAAISIMVRTSLSGNVSTPGGSMSIEKGKPTNATGEFTPWYKKGTQVFVGWDPSTWEGR